MASNAINGRTMQFRMIYCGANGTTMQRSETDRQG